MQLNSGLAISNCCSFFLHSEFVLRVLNVAMGLAGRAGLAGPVGPERVIPNQGRGKFDRTLQILGNKRKKGKLQSRMISRSQQSIKLMPEFLQGFGKKRQTLSGDEFVLTEAGKVTKATSHKDITFQSFISCHKLCF